MLKPCQSLIALFLILSCGADSSDKEKLRNTDTEILKPWLPEETTRCLGDSNPERLHRKEDCQDVIYQKLFGPEQYPGQQFVYVNGNNVRLRQAPSLDAKVMTLLPIGARVEPLLSHQGGWILVFFDAFTMKEVRAEEGTGWVSEQFLSAPSDFQPTTTPGQNRIHFGSIDTGLCFEFGPKGNVEFTTISKPAHGGIKHYKGHLLRHKDLLWPRIEEENEEPIILIDRPPELRPEYKYYNELWLSDPSEPCPR